MNSIERHERRYQRRIAKRKAKKEALYNSIGTLEEVFAFDIVFKYGKECCKGVMWKQSAQTFSRHLFSRTAKNRKRVLTGYKPRRLNRFTISERGKTRIIEAPHIDDRQIQKVMSKEVLLKLYQPQLIDDNGASLKGKGLLFSQKKLDKALRNHIKRYGINGWVIMADFKGFFPNADRNVVKKKHQAIKDWRVRAIADTITDSGYGNLGLPLGVEPSQMEMISLPSPIDNYMACQLHLRGFGHYMDDYHIFAPPDRDPKEILRKFIEKAGELNIKVSIEKTRIVPIGKNFKYCKMKRVICGDKIVKRNCRDSIVRARRKIKAFRHFDMTFEDVYSSVTSTLSYFEQTDNHKDILKLRRQFYKTFGFSCEDVNNFRKRDRHGLLVSQTV